MSCASCHAIRLLSIQRDGGLACCLLLPNKVKQNKLRARTFLRSHLQPSAASWTQTQPRLLLVPFFCSVLFLHFSIYSFCIYLFWSVPSFSGGQVCDFSLIFNPDIVPLDRSRCFSLPFARPFELEGHQVCKCCRVRCLNIVALMSVV